MAKLICNILLAAILVVWIVAILRINSAEAQSTLTLTPYADITGDGAVHALDTAGGCRAIQMSAPSTNTGVARTATTSSISTSKGQPIAAGGAFWYPWGPGTSVWQRSSVYYLVASSDKLSVGCLN